MWWCEKTLQTHEGRTLSFLLGQYIDLLRLAQNRKMELKTELWEFKPFFIEEWTRAIGSHAQLKTHQADFGGPYLDVFWAWKFFVRTHEMSFSNGYWKEPQNCYLRVDFNSVVQNRHTAQKGGGAAALFESPCGVIVVVDVAPLPLTQTVSIAARPARL